MINEALPWPPESAAVEAGEGESWMHFGSNVSLDCHGDPARAEVTVLSDGNHHMALADGLKEFAVRHPEMNGIFYVTLPPGVVQQIVLRRAIALGNLHLSIEPHILIGPAPFFEALAAQGQAYAHQPFMRSQGNVFLVRKGNPKAIDDIGALAREDVRLFISNPRTEAASYRVYRDTLLQLGPRRGLDAQALALRLGTASDRVYHGQSIHHREAPQALFSGWADVAIVYYHLALRYVRVFPDLFEMVYLLGGQSHCDREMGNKVSEFRIALVGNGGQWGDRLLAHLLGPEVTAIYQGHGLCRPHA